MLLLCSRDRRGGIRLQSRCSTDTAHLVGGAADAHTRTADNDTAINLAGHDSVRHGLTRDGIVKAPRCCPYRSSRLRSRTSLDVRRDGFLVLDCDVVVSNTDLQKRPLSIRTIRACRALNPSIRRSASSAPRRAQTAQTLLVTSVLAKQRTGAQDKSSPPMADRSHALGRAGAVDHELEAKALLQRGKATHLVVRELDKALTGKTRIHRQRPSRVAEVQHLLGSREIEESEFTAIPALRGLNRGECLDHVTLGLGWI